MRQMQSEAGPTNQKRLTMLEEVIKDHILIHQSLRVIEVEEVLWRPCKERS